MNNTNVILQSFDTLQREEMQLEQELRQMFELDSQQDLETYLTCVEQLQPETWAADIQKMYRFIHTIKGGAVTVKADAILNVAKVLEELLSDLRYLEVAPPLEDSQLIQLLLEGGEILASAMAVKETGEKAIAAVQSKVERIQILRQQIQQTYLADWSEQSQVQQEFAEQGLELLTLDLEMALGHLPEQGVVPEQTFQIAEQLLAELQQIGTDLQMASDWNSLLEDAAQLLTQPDSQLWRSQWNKHFQALKDCAKNGGKIDSSPLNSLADLISPSEGISSSSGLDGLESLLEEEEIESWEDLATGEPELETEPEIVNVPQFSLKQITKPTETEKVQIPVPLEKLEKSAQSIIEILLTARTTEELYKNLDHYLQKLVIIAKDNVQYISQLRQIQDDYALLDNLDKHSLQIEQGPTPERYRKGYVTINRLLENSLRLSEIGAEAQQTSQDTFQRLQKLNGGILQLKDIVEDSRLVPFKNLAFRVKAILRDLVDRSGKPAQLLVRGEEIELDVGTARALEPLLLHLIRNAYDHGLEASAERIQRGKSEQGQLNLTLQRYGTTFLLKLEDDGQGMDAEAISLQAQKLKLPLTRTHTSDEMLAVICQPGFSSQNQVTEISGCGVGMDVVANKITSLGGYLSLKTKPQEGTTFYLHFPVPHLLVPCLILQAGDFTFAVPTEQIVHSALLASLDATHLTNPSFSYNWEIHQDGKVIPGLDLLTYWHPEFISYTLAESAIAVYVKSQQEEAGIWLIADKMLGQSELQIQNLPSPLIPPLGLMGVSLRSDGLLMPVIEVNSLIEKLLKAPSKVSELNQPSPRKTVDIAAKETIFQLVPEYKTILIVDDAALMRRRIEASLSSYGYNTHTCADGLEAWKWLQNNPNPSLLITDIEMPNMDGFSLISRCRQDSFTFPIMVISSRIAEEWDQEARRLGASDFLTKGFSTAELINRVNSLLE